MASVTLSTAVFTVARTSRRSMADTLGNCATRSRWKRPRSDGSSGAFRIPIQVCGGASSGPGRKTNMNPPLRASSHCTSRTLETRASRMRPATSKRMVSPTPILDRSLEALLDRHFRPSARASARASGAAGRAARSAVDHLLVRLEMVAVGDRVLAAQPALPDVLDRLEASSTCRGRRSPARASPE